MIALGSITAFTLAGILAASPAEHSMYKNLKVLSKKITEDEMELTMLNFNRQLGVNCLFCHVTRNVGGSLTKTDFASDSLLNKRTARDMLKMTIWTNRKYFNLKIDGTGNYQPVVWCKTCHRGFSIPILRKTTLYPKK